ncbi:hypothetical protein HK097_010958 [Rhizophlyctis rosea]|uniref:6-phosphofructo-2-kinase domain-containing protein n=1 Tax=Rhizophlyctis rosea TaxID=64517 RepID=A0AAD5SHX0_9FUNG|nr:hypothetical protein HK097_010958 [Rhizophlyctis rosea]
MGNHPQAISPAADTPSKFHPSDNLQVPGASSQPTTSPKPTTLAPPQPISPCPRRPTPGAAQILLQRNCPVPEPCPSPIIPAPPGSTQHDAKFFDPNNPEAKAIRERLALDTLDEALHWLTKGGGKVAIHDATNSTVKRRRALLDRARKEKNVHAMFIESICTDGEVLRQNIEMKLQGPDYQNMPREEARRDFLARTENYKAAYQTINEDEERDDISFIKLIDVGKKVIAHSVHGYLASQCVFYLMQMHIKERTIWLTRHGESVYNLDQRIGGDPDLTDAGRRYSKALARFMKQMHPPTAAQLHLADDLETPSPMVTDDNFGTDRKAPLSIWTSALKRTVDSAEYFEEEFYEVKKIKALNEIYAGACENMTYKEIQENFPSEFEARGRNKLVYRYNGSGGESYLVG